MKKRLVMLALATTVVLAACGNTETTTDADDREVEAEETEEPEEDAEEAETEEPEEEAEETEEPEEETEVAEEEVADTAEYTKGISDETGYVSEWMGISFTAPEGAVMLTEEELNEAMGIGQDMLSEDFSELQMTYAEMTTVTEMMCIASDGVTNVSVAAEKITLIDNAEDYIATLEENLAQITAMDYEVVSTDGVEEIGGVEFNVMEANVDADGYVMTQKYYITAQGDHFYMMVLTIPEGCEDTAEELINGFSAM